MRGPNTGQLISALGASLILASTLFTWYVLDGRDLSVFEPASNSWFVPWLILIGGVLSILSRYGTLVASIGLWAYHSGPPEVIYFGPVPDQFAASFLGVGFWIAWIGILISLQGGSWNFPIAGFRIPNVMEWLLPAVGTVMVFGFLAYSFAETGSWTLLARIQGLPVVVMGVVMLCSGLIRTGAWARMFDPVSKR